MTHIQFLSAFFCMLFAAAAQADAGRFQFVHGDVRITHADGSSVAAVKGATVDEGDAIATGPAAQAQLTMKDGGIISMRPDSTMRIEVYRYSEKTEASSQGFFALLKGGFRSITGAIGRANQNNYKVRTPTATIGIRGTDHEPMFIPVPAPGEIPVGPPGTYDKVNSGRTYLQTAAGRVDLGANQVGFVPAVGNTSPIRLQNVPDFLKVTPSVQSANKAVPQAANDAVGPDGTTPKDAASSIAAPSPDGELASTEPPTKLARRVVLGTSDPANPRAGGGVVALADTAVAGGVLSAGASNNGSAVLGWGIYEADTNIQREDSSSDTRFYWITPGGASTTASLLRAMPSPGSTLSFSKVAGFTKPMNENGAMGGAVTSLNIVLKNLDGVPSLLTYSLAVTDAQGRNWTGSLSGTPALATLKQGSANLTTGCIGCANTTSSGSGTMQGSAFGNPNPDGFISSYRLNAGNAKVAGSVFSKN